MSQLILKWSQLKVIDFSDDGSITGRYVVSEHDKSVDELSEFIPLKSKCNTISDYW